jgi:glyoxylase-like metal-dependent hydrolase (beta-lactamase superfamily II)
LSFESEAVIEAGFHYEIGNFKCTVVSDGTLVSQGTGVDEVFGLNCLLIDSGDRKMLVDTGCGDGFQSTAGRLVKNLEATGIRCGDIDSVVFTHGHIDHASGSFDSQGRPVFPDARYTTSEKEWEYWSTPPGDNELQNMLFSAARKNLVPIRDQFDLVEENREALPGIKIIAAPGHTPGNFMVDIASGKKRLLCIGDIIHSQREFIHPEYLAAFDVAPEQALPTRARILSEVAESGALVFACHFPFPGIGYIKRKKGVFIWQPI